MISAGWAKLGFWEVVKAGGANLLAEFAFYSGGYALGFHGWDWREFGLAAATALVTGILGGLIAAGAISKTIVAGGWFSQVRIGNLVSTRIAAFVAQLSSIAVKDALKMIAFMSLLGIALDGITADLLGEPFGLPDAITSGIGGISVSLAGIYTGLRGIDGLMGSAIGKAVGEIAKDISNTVQRWLGRRGAS
jgi:hypothetical protein